MIEQDVNLEDEEMYEFDKPKATLTFKSLARGAVFLAASAASMSLGYQMAGPALAGILYGAQSQSLSTVASVKSPVAGSNASPANQKPVSGQPTVAAANHSAGVEQAPASKLVVSSTAASASNPDNSGSQIVSVPVNLPTVSFGNVSSATPAAGKVATGGSTNGFRVENAYENESKDRD